MEMGKISAAAGNLELPAKPLPERSGGGLPEEDFSKAPPEDPGFMKMAQLAALSQKRAAEAVLGKENGPLLKETVDELTLWQEKKGMTESSDAVYDPLNKAIYTGVEPMGANDFNYWHLRAYNLDGSEKWTFREEYAESPPVIDKEGNIYIRSKNKLHILDPAGKEKSSVPVEGGSWSDTPPALGPRGEIYIIGSIRYHGAGEANSRLHAFRDGHEIWHYDATSDHTGTPRVFAGKNGTVYFAAERNRRAYTFGGLLGVDYVDKPAIIALNSEDGSEKFIAKVDRWETSTTGPVAEGPDGTVYACHGRNTVTAFSPKGKKKWQYTHKDRQKIDDSSAYSRFFQPPFFDEEGNIYIARAASRCYPEGYLICLDKNGKEKWTAPVQVPWGIRTMPKIGPDGKIYCGAGDGIFVFDRKTGKQTGKFTVGEISNCNFSFGDKGELFINTNERVIALDPGGQVAREQLVQKRMASVEEGEPGPAGADREVIVEDQFVDIDGIKLNKRMKKLSV